MTSTRGDLSELRPRLSRNEHKIAVFQLARAIVTLSSSHQKLSKSQKTSPEDNVDKIMPFRYGPLLYRPKCKLCTHANTYPSIQNHPHYMYRPLLFPPDPPISQIAPS